ncbi:hypothetical protein Zmor_016425 [Zophobas morio]|uniref:Uncharacterized protein n=1 Tax=Zophobas morio TaxID=2755281 RepID=A0AA38HJC1_9CUCU|nr:hypothetical protein Zmor_016425 [Zophobas morio]
MAQESNAGGINYYNGMFNNSSTGFIDNSVAQHGEDAKRLLKDTIYAEQMLDMLVDKQDEGHAQLLTKVDLSSNQGFQITYTREDPIGNATELLEGITPAGEYYTANTITGTLKQYGKVMYATDISAVKNRLNVIERIQRQMPMSAKNTIDAIARDEFHKQAGIRIFPTVMQYTAGERMKVAKAANNISEITKDFQLQF